MSTSLRSRRHPRGRRLLGLAASLAVIATFLVPFAIDPTPALADPSTQIGSGVECANDNWQAETTADNAGHVYVFYTNYCSNHDFLFYQVSNDGGQTFGPAQTLCSALGVACTAATATHTIAGGGYKTEDDPSLFVDTSISPPKIYVTWDATTNFSSFSPEVELAAVSSDFGATFTMLNSGNNLGGATCGGGGSKPDCAFPTVTAKGNNVTVAMGSYATGASKSDQLKIVRYSADGGTTFGVAVTDGTGATNGNYFYPRRSVLDSAGNTWTLWLDFDGSANTGTYYRYEISKTTSGSSATTFSSTIYSAPDGPTFPGQAMASGGGYPADWWSGDADMAIDSSNNLYMLFQDGRGHTTDGNPSVLKMGTCATGSGTCFLTTGVAGQWTAPGANQASLPRVDDKDSTPCPGTEGAGTANCSVAFPRMTWNATSGLTISWVDDRVATLAGCSPNPRFSHVCALNMWYRTSTTGITGFTNPSIKLSDHTPFSPVWDAGNLGFKFFYGGSSGLTGNPACLGKPFAAWSESVDYNGGSTNGGRVFVKNTQTGPASPTSLTALTSGSTINLSWPASTSGGVTGYKVYRGSGAAGDNLTLLTTLGNVTSYANTGLSGGQTFSYAVSAIAGSEGCQSVRASATVGATGRTLNLATSPGAVGCSNITTTPAPTGGTGTCTRTYANGTVVTLSAATPVAIDANSRYLFDSWSGDASGSGSPTVTMSADRNVTANYVKQWAVTIQATGLTCDAPLNFYCDTGANTVATVNGTTYTGGDLSYAGSGFPTKLYIDDGGTLTYSYGWPQSVAGSTDIPQTLPPDANKQYRLDTVSGPASGTTISAAATINGTYVTQRKVTFSQTGIGGDTSGTVVHVNGTGTNPANASLVAASLGTPTFYDDGSSWAYQSPVAASAGKRYVVGTTSGTLGAADEGTTKTGAYSTQWLLTLATNPGGIGISNITPNPTSADGYYNDGISVSLTAATSASSGGSPYTFQNWTGNVASPPNSTNPISVTMNQPRSVTANYAPDGLGVSVSKTGNGSGTVTSSPAGINCGATCASSYTNGTVVTLTATPATGSNFTGWSGAGCSGTGTCVVTVDAAKSVTAQFTLQTFSLTVSKAGTGTGSVSSSPAGITCGATCSNSFNYGTVVTLTATPNAGSVFSGWSGSGCTGTGTCVVTMDAAHSVTATFGLGTHILDVSKAGTGTGSVTSSPAGIDCGATCSNAFGDGAVVTLTATADVGSDFTGWTGSGCTGTGTCIVTMDAAHSVTATFDLKPDKTLTVSKTGTGSGSVSSSPVGITCGATCSTNFAFGTVVTLTATPAVSSDFTGWSGEGCTGTSTCVVTLDQARSVTATFTLKTPTLTVSKTGTGSGSVSSSPAGITCGATCANTFDYGTSVTLTATPTTGSTFTGWSGEGCTGTSTCVVTLDQARSVTATFTLKTPTLTVSKTGTGSGSVSSSPAGITCGATCSNSFNYGTVVTLTATPAVSSDFTGWSGEGCTGTSTCVVTLDQARSVTATFTLKTPTLTVSKTGTGSGSVSSSPAGITCGATCANTFDYGTSVTLTATPTTGSTFTGWSGGGCSGTGTCVVTVDAAKSVTAQFTLQTFSLTVSKTGTGTGSVSSSPAGITCGATCANTFDYGTSVTLTATPTTGSTFTGWSGGGCSGTGTCVVSVTAATSVSAQFTLQTFSLTVSKTGTGTGSVSSSPAGITCGATCSNSFNYGTVVTLTATPNAGSVFSGWSGSGCTGTGTCVVTMDAAHSVTATFGLGTHILDVSKAGTGTGSVTSSPAGIDCGATCSNAFGDGAVVTLTATADVGSDFTGWTGSGCTGTGTCIVTMDAAHSVTATFDLKPDKTLTVSKTGTGSGSVSSSPVGITCGATCSTNFAFGTVVTLTATPAVSSDFTGWSGEGCTGTSTCVVTLDQARSVTATFTLKTPTLTVSKTGTGSGSVSSSPAGITCGATCANTFDYGTSVTLTATPTTGSTFTGWSGEGCTGTSTCVVTLDQARSVTATFTLKTPTLTVSKTGTGSGSVSSSPAGITCGATCSNSFNYGTVVTLTATPAVSSDFTGWSGEGCTGTSTCVVTLDQARSVTATFTLKTPTLTVSKTGTGSGSVSSSPAGITCGATCANTFDYGTSVTLTATPTTGSTFTGWSGGGCSGTGTCVVSVTAATSVSAQFTLQTFSLTVSKTGTGTGSVSSSPAGITCGATCSNSFNYGTVVTLTATPNAGSVFSGWSGSGCTGTGTCVVTMDAAHSVTATFGLGTHILDVSKAGTGTGSVTSSPAGIDCGATCSNAFGDGAVVTLTATADVGSDFTGWTGSGCTGTGTCIVTMDAAHSVTATFDLKPDKTLTVSKTGTGSGSVSSSPVGITCGATCSTNFAFGTVVTLTATPAVSSDFTGWSGEGCTGTSTCVVTLDQARSVTATFTLKTPTLTVSKTGTGSGSVSSSPAGITCGATCANTFDYGTSVTLTATPTTGSTFTGWSGEGCTGTSTCVVTLDQARSVTATFTLKTPTLTVSKTGTGSGSVSSSPAGITCGATCSNSFNYGTVVTLTATPAVSSDFTGWSGEGCTGTSTCVVTLDQARSVTATFTLKTPTLTVSKTGTGSGSVSSSPAGITCGATCANTFDYGTSVTLTATPTTGSTFTGWSGGGCSGTGTCVVSVTAATSVSAQFTLQTFSLTVSKTGTGTGSVSSSPAGITCGATCSNSFNYGTVVTLTATPNAGSVFSGWSGSGCTGTGTCVVTMDAAHSVTATFGLGTHILDVSKAGTGTGSVTSSPAGIDCGATCSNAFGDGAVVTLTATADVGSDFTGWTGSGCTGTGTCIVTMDAAHSVTATFDLKPDKTLTVSKTGTGSGSVSSSPVGITCGATCSTNFAFGTVVTLTATPAVSSDFTGWSGEGCTGTSTCVVTLDQARSVTATFTLKTPTLTVSKTGTGSGSVSSSPAGITCGATCANTFDYGTSVTLTATPTTGSTFTGWSGGGCSGTGTCVVSVTAATSVSASFSNQPQRSLDVTKDGVGGGSVTSTPSGIDCGSTCSITFDQGTVVTLSTTPETNSDFAGWSGEGCTGTSTCVVTLNKARSVTATFTLKPAKTLDVTTDGTGTGSVTSSPTGIDCGSTCTNDFAFGTVVTLTATPDVSADFTGWTGAGCSGTGTCIVTMDAAHSVTATFTLKSETLDVSTSGSGTGSVTSSPAGIDCGATCSTALDYGTVVGLTATPDTDSMFVGWTGDCTGTGACNVTLDQARSVTATFTAVAHQPDGRIGTSSTVAKMVGDNIYNATGKHQGKYGHAKPGKSKAFYVSVQNDGNATDTITLKGLKASKGFIVKYYVGKKDVTKAVVRGTYQIQNLAAGATAKSLKIVVKVKRTAKVGAIQKLKVTATSGVSAMDVVKGKLKTVR